MIKILYAEGAKAGELYRSWDNVRDFCQESIDQVAMVAYENKLDHRSVFTHYGYEVVAEGSEIRGFKNGVLASMNFWLDSLPGIIFEYDSGAQEGDGRQAKFYETLNKIGRVPGMQRFRTSSNLWNLYHELSSTLADAPLKLWEPSVEPPQELLEDYPCVGAMLEAAGFLGNEDERARQLGSWAFQELLGGADVEQTLKRMRDALAYQEAELPNLSQEPIEDLYAVIYAFLTGKFYEELDFNTIENV